MTVNFGTDAPDCVMMNFAPSLQMPRLRWTRLPGQQGAVSPALGQGQPSRFLSSGHSAVPPGGVGG